MKSLEKQNIAGNNGVKMAGGEGFEPSTPNLGGQVWQGTAEDWNRFWTWLKTKNYRGGHDRTIYNYCQRYSEALFKRDLSTIRDLPETLRPNVLKSLSALAKFTGQYEDWKTLIKNYGLSWVGRSGDDIVIDRLNNVQDSEEIWTWIKSVKQERPELSELLDLMAFSGLRFVEAIASYNLIVKLNREGNLVNYFKADTLEHFRFKEIFLRNTKKAFVSFVPQALINDICTSALWELSTNEVKLRVQRRGLPLRFGDIREAHGTFMTKFLKESEINFLHGRVTSNVFMQHYFNPALIADLRSRTFQGIAEIQEKVKV